MRSRGSDRYSRSFATSVVEAVWRKGRIVAGYDPTEWRADACDAWMYGQSYGDTTSPYGWEVDHIIPAATGGSDGISNLQPLQWANNRHKGDNYPNWTCAVPTA